MTRCRTETATSQQQYAQHWVNGHRASVGTLDTMQPKLSDGCATVMDLMINKYIN
jgi:hypothetical protein